MKKPSAITEKTSKKKIQEIRARPKREIPRQEAKPEEKVFLRSAQRRGNLQQGPEANKNLSELEEAWKKFGIGARSGAPQKELGTLS